MKKIIFYISFFLLVTYLILDEFVTTQKGTDRPIIQVIAAVSLIFSLLYNLLYLSSSFNVWKKWKSISYWIAFVLLFTIYYIFSFFSFPSYYAISLHREFLIAIFIFSVFISFYNAHLRGHLSKNLLYFLIAILLLNGILSTYHAVIDGLESQKRIINTSSGYVFLLILPLLMYVFKKQNLWILIITFILTLITGKRGAIIIYAILIFFSIISLRQFTKQLSIRWQTILLIGVLFVLYNIFIENAMESVMYRLTNIEDPNHEGVYGSGRSNIWETLLLFWNNGHIFEKLFGFGFFASIRYSGYIAHNDFIEFLFDFGIFGLSIWLFWFISFFRNIRKRKMNDKYLNFLLLFCLIIFIGRGIFSGTIRTDNINLSISMGILIAEYERFNLGLKSIFKQ